MAAKVAYTVREEKQGLQKQLGCMNGVLHLLDRSYLLGLNRHWRNQNRLIAGQGENGEKELKKPSNKAKERNQKKRMIEKNRASVEPSRNSCSSSSSSTSFSYFDCSKKQPQWSAPAPDIRDVVKDSMTRLTRVKKDERASLVVNHVDSPRPIHYDRKDQNLAKSHKTLSEAQKVNISRFSCDERESKYSLKSTYKVNELPRLSLDSKQNSKKNLMNRSSSGIVARLMGLDSLTDSVYKVETMKTKLAFGDQFGSGSPKVHSKIKPVVEKHDQPGSPTVKGTSSLKTHELVNRAMKPANHKARKQVKDPTPRNNKVTGERAISSLRLQRSKKGVDKECFNGPSSDSGRIRKQPVLKTRHAKIKPVDPMQNNDSPCMCSNETRNSSQEDHAVKFLKSESKQNVTQNNFAERLIEHKPIIELAKLTMEQASPVSVLDAFYVEDTSSPVKKKPNANDFDNLWFDETEWNQVGIYNYASEFHQTELLNSTKSTNGDHKYIREILLASGFLEDPDSAIRIAQLHSTGTMIKPELFHILEKTNENNPSSKSSDKVRRKLIFDSVNDILFHKLVIMSGFSGKRCARFVDGEKLMTELSLEIDHLESGSERFIYDEDDGIKGLVSADLNKGFKDWDTCCNEVPCLVVDIERLIFKDLVDGVVNVNADAAGVQDRGVRHRRRLFSM